MGRQSRAHKQRVQALVQARIQTRERKIKARKLQASRALQPDSVKEESVEEEEQVVHVVVKEEVVSDTQDKAGSDNYGDSSPCASEDNNEEEKDLEEESGVDQVKAVNSKNSHCLLCYQTLARNLTPAVTRDPAKANHLAMFILQKMLQVPRHKLEEFLKHVGSPSEWIVFCKKCLSLVDKAFRLETEIQRLEEKLRKCQEEMLEEIKRSWREEELLVGLQKSSLQVPASVFKILRATNEIRHLVQSKDSLMADDSDGEDDDRISYEMQRKQRAPPPQSTDSKDDGDDECSEGGSPPQNTVYVSVLSSETANVNSGDSNAPVIIQCPFERHSAPPGEESSDDGNFNDAPTTDGVKPRMKVRERKIITRDTAAFDAVKYNCSACPHLGAMSLHNFMHHGLFHFRRSLKCTQCGVYFSSALELKKSPFPKDAHVCSSDTLVQTPFQPGKLWECSKCSEKFASDLERDSHEMSCDAPGATSNEVTLIYSCGSCSKQFRNLTERLLHRVFEHPEAASQSCLVCDKSFCASTVEGVPIPDVQETHLHLRKKHKYYSQYKIPNDCDFCGAIFTHSTALQAHLEGTHKVKKSSAYLCPICYTRFPIRGTLRKHLTLMHNLGGQAVPVETFFCDMCGHQTKQRQHHLEHKFLKHGVEPEGRHIFQCSTEGCAFRALRPKDFARHMMKEHGEKRKWVCQLCGKGFLTNTHLRRHEEIHRNKNAGLKPFQCEICGNSFAVRNYLYIHMRLSHQNRPFASTNKKKPSRKRKRAQEWSQITPATSGVTNVEGVPSAEPTHLNVNPSQGNSSLVYSENNNMLANLTSL